jgi:hypothetical protein
MMARRLVRAALAALLLALGAGGAAAQIYATPKTEPQFRVEWQAGKSRKGAPILEGYVYNTRPIAASDVRLLVEILDAQGSVIGKTYGVVFGVVNAFDRVYFDVPLPMTGAGYRVSVSSFELRGGGGGGM